MIQINSIETYTLPYVKQRTSASSMHDLHEAGHPKPVIWDNPEGQGGEGRGTPSSGMGGHIYNCGRFMLIYGKNHQNIVKNYSPIKLMIKKKKESACQ